MPTASELINTAKMSQKTTDEKMAELREIINGLTLRLNLVEKELNQLTRPKEENVENPISCRRCGRKGHWTLGCKQTTDVHGNKF